MADAGCENGGDYKFTMGECWQEEEREKEEQVIRGGGRWMESITDEVWCS